MGWSILFSKGSLVNISKTDLFMSLKIVFILANSAGPECTMFRSAFYACGGHIYIWGISSGFTLLAKEPV